MFGKTVKVDSYPSLVKDEASGAILNISESERQNYLKQRASAQSRMQEIQDQKTEIQKLKDEMAKIRELFSQLVK